MIRRFFVASAASLIALGAKSARSLQEQTRIDRLIMIIETRSDMRFIRNGSEYDGVEAARFLRGKLETMGKDVNTAREFIEQIASRSSMSGQPYQVKFADGKTMAAGKFLLEELSRLEAHLA